MKFSMAEFWAMITLLTAAFAAVMYLNHEPDCIGAVLILAVPIHAIVHDVTGFMQRSGLRGKRII